MNLGAFLSLHRPLYISGEDIAPHNCAVLSLEKKGLIPEICTLCFVILNKRSFERFYVFGSEMKFTSGGCVLARPLKFSGEDITPHN